MAKPREGVFRADAGTVDEEGFIAPSVGLVEHALHFTCAPDVLAKTRQILDADRMELPGAVVVWDETIGRRKGSKAAPGSWWATSGSVTMSLVFGRAYPRASQPRLSCWQRQAPGLALAACRRFVGFPATAALSSANIGLGLGWRPGHYPIGLR